MKKQLIAAAIAAAVASPAALAGAPTVYGQLNISLNGGYVTTSATDTQTTDVTSNASRIGVKGSEDLGNGLAAVYKIEYGTDIATKSNTMTRRTAFAGIKGAFGTVVAGYLPKAGKSLQVTDTFIDGFGDYGNKMDPTAAGKYGITTVSADGNVPNAIAYIGKFNNVTLVLGVTADGNKNSPLDGAYTAGIAYGSKKSGLYLSATQTTTAKTPSSKSVSVNTIGAQYTGPNWMVNITHIWDDVKNVDNKNTQINGSYTIGMTTLRAKVAINDTKSSVFKSGDLDETLVGVGVDFALGKKTTLYVEGMQNMVRNDKKGKIETPFLYSVGVLHKF